MSAADHVARVSTVIEAPKHQVWAALVDPEMISRYMFGARVESDWEVGSPITWDGEWEGQRYQDKGEILEIEPDNVLSYSHFSPLSGLEDIPENHHTVRILLTSEGGATTATLMQDNNETAEAREHAEGNWRSMLDTLKGLVEEDAESQQG